MKVFSVLAIVLGLLFNSMAQDTSSASSKKVLLSYEKTKFKSALIKEMSGLLKNDSAVSVTIVEHSEKKALSNESAEKYDAVFISNSGVNSKIRPWIVAWIDKNITFKDKILLHTTQTRNWKVVTPVDAVTSASDSKKVKDLAKEYVSKLKNLYSGAPSKE